MAAALVLRAVVGALFLLTSVGKFRRHDAEASAFDRYGIPVPELATYLVGALELVGGLLLVCGFLTRPAAIALGANMIGALATAGRIEPNFMHTGLPPILIVVLAILTLTGAGAYSVDHRLARRIHAPHAAD